ncbi:D-glycero-alpha-D-manno-heptose-1,7-bisphosphate 7-phosphatase, partial [Micromonospora sp. URMC 106]|uniref:D-glycero-alpha-D-manno-heptose-1,7-bisphosphate 7-phosphatase n=1 Tax=Micromonospora sp. URMC 106 TaxID=3423408 RepID=UPI003F1C86B0
MFDAVLLDRDGTLVEDVPYNGDPEKVRVVPGARVALDRLRAAGLRLAVVTNQSGLARGLFCEAQMRAVHARVEQLLGPFDAWLVCPHDDGAGCGCRKPAPGLVYAAARVGTVLVVRSDSAGDVLVTGAGVRAVAAGARRVVMLCGPRGRAAAELLPGVDEVIEHRLPWIDPVPEAVDAADMRLLCERLAAVGAEEAVVFTSFHQSPLPLALLLRLAGVPRISAISDDYPGSLLDVR